MANRRTMLVVASTLWLAACSGGASPVGPVTDQVVPSNPGGVDDGGADSGAVLVVWADADSVDVLRSAATSFAAATGVDVLVREVEVDDVRSAILAATPDEPAPDIFIGRHVWAGELADADLVVPLALDAARGRFLGVALDGFNVDGRLYAVPATVEAMAMYRNTSLVAEPPDTWDDLRAACSFAEVDTCVAVPGGSTEPDAYPQFAFLSAYGGFVFDYDDATGFDPAAVGIDAAATVEGARFLEREVTDGIIPDISYDEAKQRFVDGRAAFWLSGPWELEALDETDIEFGVSMIPPIGSEPTQAFVGATGWYVSAGSTRIELAQTFLVDYVAADDTQSEFVAAGVADSAWSAAARSLPDSSPAQVFADAASLGVAIPNIVEMAEVWEPLGERLAQLRRGDLGAQAALTLAADEVRSAIGG